MTPTTCSPEFVAAIMRAGYHVEFAAGGYHSADSLRTALYRLRDLMPAGRSVTINIIYVSPKSIAWQIPLIRQLRDEGFPLTGLTVGGGVPSPTVATEYITSLGLEHISFKPGSVAAIRQVIEIARTNPTFPVILQWTGGRGGGHHSAEDFHAPILETYAEIRACTNIALVAGSGFGSAKDVIPYFTGSWSSAFGKTAPMPFDGVLFGSRVMTCAEARTSPSVKEAIAATQGVTDTDWEGTYTGATGGIISVVSEMGEPIHVVATRGAQFWAEMDKAIFSLDKKKRVDALMANKGYIITRLNQDFQRPWFGRGSNGQPCDVSQMTYAEVATRLIQLMFVMGRRWIDESYSSFVAEFLFRIEERFATGDESLISESAVLASPIFALSRVLRAFPAAARTQICAEDVHYFMQLCRAPGQKPVPFVPALDENFETWFKKDSLWQSEDVEAVVDQDAGRTFILHGPVAARHTCLVDEPVADVLNAINNGVANHFAATKGVSVMYEECLKKTGARICAESRERQSFDVSHLSGEGLRDLLASCNSWADALLSSKSILRGHDLARNPIRELFQIVNADTAVVDPGTISLFTKNNEGAENLLIQFSKSGSELQVLPFTYTTAQASPVSMLLKFEYHPEASYCPIWEIMGDRNERIAAMYRQLWQGNAVQQAKTSPESAIFTDSFVVTPPRVRSFNRAVGYTKTHQREKVPMDFAIVASWSSVCKALLQQPIQGDVLNLVHLSNAYESCGESLRIGEKLQTRAYVSSITIEDSGKVVEVECELLRASATVVKIRSRFLFRGNYTDYSSTFQRRVETPYELKVTSASDFSVLASKSWLFFNDDDALDNLDLTDLTLEFHLRTSTKWQSKLTFSNVDTIGKIFVRSESGDLSPVGFVKHHAAQTRDNAVLSYLSRRGQVVATHQQHPLDGSSSDGAVGVYKVAVPASNEAYSRASGDFNPIHTSPMFAQLVGLPGTITHGMYCSAAVRAVVEKHAAGGNPNRIKKYDVSFVGMVMPTDVLEINLCHRSMQAGLKIIDIEVTKQGTGEKVLSGAAHVAQPSTTIVFTGQGSQEQGMGMDLYASSAAARAVWDRADDFFLSQFGLSILDIVRNNPREVKVHFGGVKGRALRQKYLAMHYEAPPATPGGKPQRRQMFPTITERSASFTHTSPQGLLFATQFAQPCLVIMEMAAYRDMQAAGVVDTDCHFAGHSLGEYAALASITDFMPFEALMYIIFCRGMTMQSAVERDEKGRSAFSMVAVDPSRVRKDLSDSGLRDLVALIQRQSGFFVEIVNLNIRDGQYVCAGDLRALDLLQKVCDDLKVVTLPPNWPLADCFAPLIARHAPAYAAASPYGVQLKRGTATVPLAGVDVPFHSSLLRPRMGAFRAALRAGLDADRLRPERLVGKYVPNVTGAPFAIDRAYFEQAIQATGSEALRGVVEGWQGWMDRVERERLGHTTST
ncbi:fatty acid synthase [Xylariales sp. PMI_506]|nr:fatty acid synthase [Xylariales sp. PMI_506]